MSDITPPGASSSPASIKAKGRGLAVLLAIEPSISKKDISEIRKRLVNVLSDSFSSVELSYYARDKSSAYLKILAEQATFSLGPEEVKGWYSRLLAEFLQRFAKELRQMNYRILDSRVEFLTRTRPQEKEEDFIALPTPEEIAGLLPPLSLLTGESPAPSPPSPIPPESTESAKPPLPESKEGTPPPVSVPETKETSIPPPPAPARERKPSAPPPGLTPPESPHLEQKAVPRPLIERELRGPEELAYREKARRESEEQRLEEGIRTCLEGLEKYPDSPYLLYLLGSLVSSQGKDTDALGIFDHLIAIHPDFAEAYLARGRIRRRAGDATGAEQDLAKARDLEPGLIVRD